MCASPGYQRQVSGKVTLGYRAEDASLAHEGRREKSRRRSTRSSYWATRRWSRSRRVSSIAAVKTDKDYKAEIGEPVSISVPRCDLSPV
jgi:multiple sugar transport system ATP-binding protein